MQEEIYWALQNKLDVFLKSDRRLLIVIGSAGIGKTFQVERILTEKGKAFKRTSGVNTPAGLNDFLAQNSSNGKVIVMDDVEGYVEDMKAISIIKAGTSEPYRVVWNSKDRRIEFNQWENKGKWIIIMNRKPKAQAWQAIFSRAYLVQLNIPFEEQIILLREVAKEKNIPLEIVNLIEAHGKMNGSVDLRTLFKINEYYVHAREHWERLALTELQPDVRLSFLKEIIELPIAEQAKQFIESGLGSRATFFRLRKRL